MTTTISVQELQTILNVLAKAPTTVGEGLAIAPILQKAVRLANQPHPIGAIGPAPGASVPDSEPTVSER